MFTWPEIVLLLLKITNMILDKINYNQGFQAGTDAEIAKISAAILRKTQAGKAIMEKVDAMSDAEVDAGLRGLEPK
jgi:hypothetical protein